LQVYILYRGNALPSNSFSKLVLAAVDESLSSLGDSSRQAIFFHLEASFKIKRESIPSNLAEFSEALEGIFGPGAPYLEELIARRLHEELGLTFEGTECTNLSECIDTLKKHAPTEGETTAQ
jgi:hypothetical protein